MLGTKSLSKFTWMPGKVGRKDVQRSDSAVNDTEYLRPWKKKRKIRLRFNQFKKKIKSKRALWTHRLGFASALNRR